MRNNNLKQIDQSYIDELGASSIFTDLWYVSLEDLENAAKNDRVKGVLYKNNEGKFQLAVLFRLTMKGEGEKLLVASHLTRCLSPDSNKIEDFVELARIVEAHNALLKRMKGLSNYPIFENKELQNPSHLNMHLQQDVVDESCLFVNPKESILKQIYTHPPNYLLANNRGSVGLTFVAGTQNALKKHVNALKTAFTQHKARELTKAEKEDLTEYYNTTKFTESQNPDFKEDKYPTLEFFLKHVAKLSQINLQIDHVEQRAVANLFGYQPLIAGRLDLSACVLTPIQLNQARNWASNRLTRPEFGRYCNSVNIESVIRKNAQNIILTLTLAMQELPEADFLNTSESITNMVTAYECVRDRRISTLEETFYTRHQISESESLAFADVINAQTVLREEMAKIRSQKTSAKDVKSREYADTMTNYLEHMQQHLLFQEELIGRLHGQRLHLASEFGISYDKYHPIRSLVRENKLLFEECSNLVISKFQQARYTNLLNNDQDLKKVETALASFEISCAHLKNVENFPVETYFSLNAETQKKKDKELYERGVKLGHGLPLLSNPKLAWTCGRQSYF